MGKNYLEFVTVKYICIIAWYLATVISKTKDNIVAIYTRNQPKAYKNV